MNRHVWRRINVAQSKPEDHMKPVTDEIVTDFLDTWVIAHSPGPADYDAIAIYYESRSRGLAPIELREALRKGRLAREWPDPDPRVLQPTVEMTIIALIGLVRKWRPTDSEDEIASYDAAVEIIKKATSD
jgi:hypothetical protein